MKVNKQIVSTEEIDIAINEVTLLSETEYLECKPHIKPISGWRWLRSPGHIQLHAALVFGDGSLGNIGVYNDFGCVRPALRISNLESSNLKIDDKFELDGKTWTVISNELALCDSWVKQMAFRPDWQAPDANQYEKSDVKKWLDEYGRRLVEVQQ